MNRREKLATIKGLIIGSITPNELKRDIEVWIQEKGLNTFRKSKSEETLTRDELNNRELIIGKSKLIKVEFVSGKQIL